MKKMIILALILCLAALPALAAIEYPCEGIANAGSVRVRSKASTSAKETATLKKGEAVTILDATETKSALWYHVQTAKGKKGYVLSDYLSVPDTAAMDAAEHDPQGKKMDLTVKYSCKDYNSVGKKWTQYFEVYGVHVEDNRATVFAAPGIGISLYARIRDQDSKPETGTEITEYVPTAADLADGFTVSQSVAVTENNGRYIGNTATWTVTYTFTPAE